MANFKSYMLLVKKHVRPRYDDIFSHLEKNSEKSINKIAELIVERDDKYVYLRFFKHLRSLAVLILVDGKNNHHFALKEILNLEKKVSLLLRK